MNQNSGKCVLAHNQQQSAAPQYSRNIDPVAFHGTLKQGVMPELTASEISPKLAVCPKLDSQESSLPVSARKTNEASTREGAGFCYSVGLSPVAGSFSSIHSRT